MICSVEGCGRKATRRGWCTRCYSRWRAHGDPTAYFGNQVTPPEVRFWRKVDKDGPVAINNPELGRCWLWMGSRGHKGHGHFGIAPDNVVSAHRYSYELVNGPVPRELMMDHFACDNPPCVNPTHVRPVTPRENSLRSHTSLGAVGASRTHCPQGHPYDAANTRTNAEGHRWCRTCHREKGLAAWRAKHPPRPPITHCPAGHPYDEANTYVDKRGRRGCRTCRAERARTKRQGAQPGGRCPAGHLLDEANSYMGKGGWLRCRECQRKPHGPIKRK